MASIKAFFFGFVFKMCACVEIGCPELGPGKLVRLSH